MFTYTFYWSPEGRKLCTIKAKHLGDAKAAFRKAYPTYAKFMGEVYVQTER